MEFTQSEEQKEKQGPGRSEKGPKNLFEKISANNLSNLGNETDIQVQEA